MSKEKKCSGKNEFHKQKLICQFPSKSEEDNKIKKEINIIMASALREYMNRTL